MLIEVPRSFDLKSTVTSHGWYQLAPYCFDADAGGLSYVFTDRSGGKPVDASAVQDQSGLRIEIKGRSAARARGVALDGFERALSIDSDFGEFHDLAKKDSRLSWIANVHAGRLLRSPTVFEDLVKTICTTNCTWSLTRAMVANLVESLGEAADSGNRAFPTPDAMAAKSEDFYRSEIKSGYRSAYLLELAESVANGELDPESWMDPALSSEELRKKLLGVKGVGRYAAENMLKLLGHYDGLALDSFLRSEFYKRHSRGKKCPDARIERHYRKYGKWRGLAIWFDMCSPEQ